MGLLDFIRQQAGYDHYQNPQTPMANEQAIRDAQQRDAYNAELARQRQADEERRNRGY